MIEHLIPDGIKPMPVVRYIMRAWPLASARAVKDAAKNRDIRINGLKMQADAEVGAGDTIKLYLSDAQMGIAPAEFAFVDENVIAAVKPAGLPVDVDRNEVGADTLLLRVQKEYPEAQLAHRLDAGTGGVILLSRNEKTNKAMLNAFKNHTLEKRYTAVLRGEMPASEGVLKAYLTKKAADSTVSVSKKALPSAKPIVTRYAVLSENMMYSVIEAEPVTGRTHQLRAHFASEGHPILGDDKYGDREFNRKFKKTTPMLWCKSIRFTGAPGLERYENTVFAAKPRGFEEFL